MIEEMAQIETSPPLTPGEAPAFAETATPAFSPLYQQIKGLMLQSLQGGEWKPGEAIPSEMDLAARFRVSQGTMRKAIDELAAENWYPMPATRAMKAPPTATSWNASAYALRLK
jgi:DNA-binding transcriptional MocR family regulator